MTDEKPGRELPKDYRSVAEALVNQQGWRYQHGKKHATLYPADRSSAPIVVPTTPSDARAFKNFLAQIRRAGGIWP